MNILVTGGAGFIGSHVCERLLREGHSVCAFDDLNDFYSPALKQANLRDLQSLALPFTFIHGDLTDPAAVAEAFASAQFDQVIHLAARAGVRPAESTDARPAGAQQPTHHHPQPSQRTQPSHHHGHALAGILGPAFVASVAYVDPGNVAANITSGARYGYLLVWVLVLANCMSVLIQYQSAKLGIVTGKSLPEILGERLGDAGRFMFFMQAEVIAIATDLAEVIGGAISLKLLFGLPLPLGGVITGAVSLALLVLHSRRGPRIFERVVVGLVVGTAMALAAARITHGLEPMDFAVPDFGETKWVG